MSSCDERWALYEAMIARFEEKDRRCEIFLDHSVMGQRSGISRQVDVWVKTEVGGMKHEITIAVECRAYASHNKIGIKDMDAFCGFLEDVGASKGVLVTTSSFTKGAAARAKGANIEAKTLTFEEALDFDWSGYVTSCANFYVSGCWGTIGWHYRETPNGSNYGHCDHCDQLHIRCGFCEHVDSYFVESSPLSKHSYVSYVQCSNDECHGGFTIYYNDADEVDGFHAELREDEDEAME